MGEIPQRLQEQNTQRIVKDISDKILERITQRFIEENFYQIRF